MTSNNSEKLKSLLVGRRLSGIKLYQVNDGFSVFNPDCLAIIDGAVEMDFEGQKLMFAWDLDLEMFILNTAPLSLMSEDSIFL